METKKSELLKELGWDDELIRHYMINDSVLIEHDKDELKPETFETNTVTFVYNSNFTGSFITRKD